jgi:hypothetical protein
VATSVTLVTHNQSAPYFVQLTLEYRWTTVAKNEMNWCCRSCAPGLRARAIVYSVLLVNCSDRQRVNTVVETWRWPLQAEFTHNDTHKFNTTRHHALLESSCGDYPLALPLRDYNSFKVFMFCSINFEFEPENRTPVKTNPQGYACHDLNVQSDAPLTNHSPCGLNLALCTASS